MGNIANSIEHIEHLKAFDDVFKKRFEELDFSSILVYIIDNAPSDSLYYLAQQFGVLGYKGWILATTDDKKRALLKKAIDLHKHAGTIYAIEEAVKSVGFTHVEVVEHVGVYYDGEFNHDNTITYAGGNWASFLVRIGLDNDFEITASSSGIVRRFIEEWKNARSHLVTVVYLISFTDIIDYNDDFLNLGEDSEDIATAGIYYNGLQTYDGSNNYDKSPGLISLTITNADTGEIINDEF